MNYQDEIKQIYDTIKSEPMMNDERKIKVLLLLEMAQDILLEEELTRGFFRDIRGGEAV